MTTTTARDFTLITNTAGVVRKTEVHHHLPHAERSGASSRLDIFFPHYCKKVVDKKHAECYFGVTEEL